jgi:hypothetical protein
MDGTFLAAFDILVLFGASGSFVYLARVRFILAIESVGRSGTRSNVRRRRRGGRCDGRRDADGFVLQRMERADCRWLGSQSRIVSDSLRPSAGIGRGQRRRGGGFSPRPRNLRVLVLMFCIAGHAAGSLHLLADHRDDGVVGKPAFPRTIVVQDVTKPKLTLLHSTGLQTSSLAGKGTAKGPRC